MRIRKLRRRSEDDSQERYLQDKLVIPAARELGWLVYHTHDSRRSGEGFPDLTLVRHGRGPTWLIFAELKAPGKQPTPVQRAWLALLDKPASGVRSYLWRLADWDNGSILEALR